MTSFGIEMQHNVHIFSQILQEHKKLQQCEMNADNVLPVKHITLQQSEFFFFLSLSKHYLQESSQLIHLKILFNK